MYRVHIAAAVGGVLAASATAAPLYISHWSGLSAEVEFSIVAPTVLEIRVRNSSTGAPVGFDESDQLLTGVSWDFGLPGSNPGDPQIAGGSVHIGPASASVNFSTGWYGPGSDVSGEYGYGNDDGSGALLNFVSANAAHALPFGGSSLDGPSSIDGPQGGLVAMPPLVPLSGMGAIQDEFLATLLLDMPLTSLAFIDNGVRVEFGSDRMFITIPEPSGLGLIALAALIGARRRPLGNTSRN